MIIDTPGQIEAFSQSASGQIITETLGCTFPTVSLYVADTVRCENPNTFMSNMLYSLSILYKSKLPLLIVFNKIDVLDHSFAEKWMKDFDEFDAALGQVDTYLSSLILWSGTGGARSLEAEQSESAASTSYCMLPTTTTIKN